MARDVVKVEELAGRAASAEQVSWAAVYSLAGGHGGAGRPLPPGRLEECGRASNAVWIRYQSCHRS
jgi:hypothetical protein